MSNNFTIECVSDINEIEYSVSRNIISKTEKKTENNKINLVENLTLRGDTYFIFKFFTNYKKLEKLLIS